MRNFYLQELFQRVLCILSTLDVTIRSRDSSVSIAVGSELDGCGSIPDSATFVPSPQRSDKLWGPPSLLYSEYRGRALSLGVKQMGHEADHSPLSGAEFKIDWSYTSTPHTALRRGAT
jgi:hypothetical protein